MYVAGSAAYAARQASATPQVTVGAALSVGDTVAFYYSHDTSTSGETVPTDQLGNTYQFDSVYTDANFQIHRVVTGRITVPGTPVLTCHLPGTPSAGAHTVVAYRGRDGTTWVADVDVAEFATPGTGTDQVASPSLTVPAGADLLCIAVNVNGNQNVFTAGTGFTERIEQGGVSGTDLNVAIADIEGASAGATPATATTSDATRTVVFGLALAAGTPPATVDQADFRWGEDDANEASHTWAAAQGANLTAALGTKLLRLILDASNDPAAFTPKLYFQKNGAGGYVAVPVGATTPAVYGTVSFGAIGTGANGTTTVAPSYPTGITAGQYLLCVVTSGATNSETPTTPSGWTLLATGASTDGSFGIDTGPRRVTVFGKVADGTESGTLTVSITNGDTCRGTISRFTKAGSGAWVVDAQGGADSTSGTGFSVTLGSMNWNTGDVAVVAVGQRVDTVTQSAQSLTASGVTFGTRTNRASTAVTIGNDHRHVVDTFAAVTGTSNVDAAPTWAFTGSAACSGGCVVVRLREYTAAVNNEVYIAPSANIAAGGEATTARLTPPGAKTTSDFATGRRWDDENGADSLDPGADEYTEVEWAVAIASPGSGGDYYDFRAYNNATPFDTYTATARWTIAGAGSISGVAAITLADAIATATGVIKLLAALSLTLGDTTLAAAAALDLLATASVSLGDVTPSASGALVLQAQASSTLANVTPAATAALAIAGTAGKTLDDVVLAATGTVVTPGQEADTRLAVRMASAWYRGLSLSYQLPSGATPIQGQAAITLADVSPASTANLAIAAAATIGLGDTTVAGTGALDITGQVGVTLGSVTPGATGAVVIKAASSVTLGDVTVTASGSGVAVSIGTADVILGPMTATAAGAVTIASQASFGLGDVQVSASGGIRLLAAASVQLQPVAMVATGLVSDTPETPAVFVDSKTRLSQDSLPYRTRSSS